MSKLTIEQPHALDPSTVKQRLETLSARLAEKYGIRAVWKSDTHATFDRTGATGSIEVSASRVVIHVELAFLLKPMQGKIEHRIKEELARALVAEPAGE